MEFDKAYFDAGLERRGTDCMKWDGMMEEHRDPDMVPMWGGGYGFPVRARHPRGRAEGRRSGNVGLHDERRSGCVRAARLLEAPPRGQL